MNFNDEYYKKTIKEYNYNPMDFAPMDFEFNKISPEIMDSKWLCHSGINNITDYSKTIITSGIGLSGVPHMGTLSQILRLIFLQKYGFTVQMVLGDLDSYNARNVELELVLQRAKLYEEFIIELGFDAKKGILRSQYEETEVLRMAFLTSKYLKDKDFEDTEEDLSELYKKEKIYEGITFPVKQSILLMVADFLYLGCKKNYKEVVVMLGLEEHQYVLLARKALERMKLDFNIYGMYSRIIKGLNGYPKMSKSILASSIRVDMSKDEIMNTIINEKDIYDNPDDSVIYQLMSNVSLYSLDELKKIYTECESRSKEWNDIKISYGQMLADICNKWQIIESKYR